MTKQLYIVGNCAFLFIAVFIFAVQPPSAYSQTGESGDTISVVVTGIGQDGESALQNALRAAVQQAVGVLVSAETLVENDEVIRDRILSFSGGFVQTYRQIGEPTTEGGLVSIRIAAEVRRNDLRDRLQREGVIRIAVNPDRVRFEIIAAQTRAMAQADGIEMLLDLLEGFPLNVYDISGDLAYHESTGSIGVDVEIRVNMQKYAAFEREFAALITQVGGTRLGARAIRVSRESGTGNTAGMQFTDFVAGDHIARNDDLPRLSQNNFMISFADRLPNFRFPGQADTASFTSYTMPMSVWDRIRPLFEPERRNMVIQAMDSNGNVLATRRIGFDLQEQGQNRIWMVRPWIRVLLQGWTDAHQSNRGVVVFPWLNAYVRDSGTVRTWPGTSEHTIRVPLNLSPDARVTAVHISVEQR